MLPQSIANYKNREVIKRFSIEENIPLNDAQQKFNKLKTFLYQASIEEKPSRPNEEIDKIWHIFLLYTRDYQMFCQEYLGKFIHHVPDKINNKAREIMQLS